MNREQLEYILSVKTYHRFTGPPEHWLTAIKHRTWGLRLDKLGAWQKIEVGDVFLMHSTISKKYRNTASSIIGIGVVGPGLRQKENYLWEEEFEKRENIYPLLIPFSEIYLFSELDEVLLSKWMPSDNMLTKNLIEQLLSKATKIPDKFPKMGSFSKVKDYQAIQIIERLSPETIITKEDDYQDFVNTPQILQKMNKAEDTIKNIPTLKYLFKKQIKPFETKTSIIERDNQLLERANNEHLQIIEAAREILEKQGYEILYNIHADLVAEDEKKLLLFEAKSIPEGKFRPQARRALGQLYQYQYFDIKEHLSLGDVNKKVQKILIVPEDPNDKDYVAFLGWADVETCFPDRINKKLIYTE